MKSLFGPSEIAGIELTRDEVRAVTLSVTVRGYQISGLYRIPLNADTSTPFPERAASALKSLGHTWTSSPEWIVSALDGHQIVARKLSVPEVKLEPGSSLIKYEMEPHLSFDVEDALVTFLPRNAKESQKEVVAFAAQKGQLQEHLKLLDQASLQPRVVGVGSLGAYLCYRFSDGAPEEDAEKVIAMMDLDREEMHLTVFDARGPILVRSVDTGIAVETKDRAGRHPDSGASSESSDVVSAMGKELARQLELSCLQSKVRPDELILTGEASSLPGLGDALSSAVRMPCRIWDPLTTIPNRLDEQKTRNGSAFASVLGVALSALQPERKRPDFLVEEFTFKRPLAQIRGKLIYLASVAALILIVMAAGFLYRLQDRKQELNALKQEIRRVYTDTFPASKVIVDELEQMRTSIRSARETLSTLGFGKGRVRTLDLVAALSKRIPKDSGIRIIELVIDSEAIRLSGEAGTFEAVDALKERLSTIPEAAEVKVEQANLSSFEKKIEFSISVNRKK